MPAKPRRRMVALNLLSSLFLGAATLVVGLCLLAGCRTITTQTGAEELATPTPFVYITPTPDAPILPPGTYEAVNEAAGTATRAAVLTFVPTWPPGVPMVRPTLPPSTPYSPIPTSI